MRRLLLAAALLALAAARSQAALTAAAGKADITPDLERETVWLAGYGAKGRRARGVRDPLHVRALVLSDGKRRLALVGVDSIGIFRDDVEEIRRLAGFDGPDSYLLLSATHDHSAPDTLGLWGRLPGVSGVDARYHRRLKQTAAGLVRELSGRLKPARLTAARAELDPRGLCKDLRDPAVLDPELNVLQVRGAEGGVIGTVVRWSCHAEVLGSDNPFVTADYPGPLCGRVEERLGGSCLFLPGVIGGLMAPEVDRSPGLEHQFAAKDALGRRVAEEAIRALRAAERVPVAEISFASRAPRIPVENSRYLLFLRSLAFGHELYQADGKPLPAWKTYWYPLRHLVFFPLPERLRPWVETEVSLVRIGTVKILGIPGELFPELAIGGYDGRHAYGRPLVRPGNQNPPELEKAPKGPYLRDRLRARHGWIVGLANDEIGYIVPEYDFQVAPTRSMTPRPPGTHYEETNSIGRRATGILLRAAEELLQE